MSRQLVRVTTAAGRPEVVGFVENLVFYRKVTTREHLYEVLNAWGLDCAIFDEVVAGCHQVRLYDEQAEKVYVVHPRLWAQQGVRKSRSKGANREIFLDCKFFTVEDSPAAKSQKLAAFLRNRGTALCNQPTPPTTPTAPLGGSTGTT